MNSNTTQANPSQIPTKTYFLNDLFVDQEERYVVYIIPHFLAIIDAPNNTNTTFEVIDKQTNVKFRLEITWDYQAICRKYQRICDDVKMLQEQGPPGGEHGEEGFGVIIAMILSSLELKRRVIEFAKRTAPDLKFCKSPLEGVEAAARTGAINQTIFGTKPIQNPKPTKNLNSKGAKGKGRNPNSQKKVGKWRQLESMANISLVYLSVTGITKKNIFWEKVK